MFRRTTLCILVLTVAISPIVSAQTIDDAIALGRSVIETERQAVAAASLELSEAESIDFWPAYREYQSAIAKADSRFLGLLRNYVQSSGMMTDKEAKSMAYDYFSIEKKRLSVRKKYHKKFRKIVGEKKAIRVLQIENKMDSILRYGLAEEMPLMW